MQTYISSPRMNNIAWNELLRTPSLVSTSNHQQHQPLSSRSIPNRRLPSEFSNNYKDNSLNTSLSALDSTRIEYDGVISTKTITHVDPNGEIQSVTTETITELPDGSSIVEKTTNFMRQTSMCNSSRFSPSLTEAQDNYNLIRIDEELNNFAYSYLDSVDKTLQGINTQVSREPLSTSSQNASSPIKSIPIRDQDIEAQCQVNRELKSILKKTSTLNLLPLTLNQVDESNSEFPTKDEHYIHGKNNNRIQKTNSSSGCEMTSIELEAEAPRFKAPKMKCEGGDVASRDSLIFNGDLRRYQVKSQKGLEARNHESEVLRSNYAYKNHHRKFRTHSLRDAPYSIQHSDYRTPSRNERNKAVLNSNPRYCPTLDTLSRQNLDKPSNMQDLSTRHLSIIRNKTLRTIPTNASFPQTVSNERTSNRKYPQLSTASDALVSRTKTFKSDLSNPASSTILQPVSSYQAQSPSSQDKILRSKKSWSFRSFLKSLGKLD